MKTIKFTCPDCGDHKIVEVTKSFTSVELTDKLFADDTFNYRKHSKNSSKEEVTEYACEKCDFLIADTADNLIKWLTKKDMITEN